MSLIASTTTGDDVATPVLAQPIPSGTEMYDTIMAQIEPDLVTAELPLLKEKYKEETSEQRAERAQCYEKAFALYAVRFQEYTSAWNQNLHQAVNAIKAQQEQEMQAANEEELGSIDNAISAA